MNKDEIREAQQAWLSAEKELYEMFGPFFDQELTWTTDRANTFSELFERRDRLRGEYVRSLKDAGLPYPIYPSV